MSMKRLEDARDKGREALDNLYYWGDEMQDSMKKIVALCDDADDDNWQSRVEEIRGIAGNY
jgi:hypothetical protein